MPSTNSTDGTTETLDLFDYTDCEETTHIFQTQTKQVVTEPIDYTVAPVPSVTLPDSAGRTEQISTDSVSTKNTQEITVITTETYLTSKEPTSIVTVSTSNTKSSEEATTEKREQRKKRYLKDQLLISSEQELSQYKIGPGFFGALLFSIINLGKYNV